MNSGRSVSSEMFKAPCSSTVSGCRSKASLKKKVHVFIEVLRAHTAHWVIISLQGGRMWMCVPSECAADTLEWHRRQGRRRYGCDRAGAARSKADRGARGAALLLGALASSRHSELPPGRWRSQAIAARMAALPAGNLSVAATAFLPRPLAPGPRPCMGEAWLRPYRLLPPAYQPLTTDNWQPRTRSGRARGPAPTEVCSRACGAGGRLPYSLSSSAR